jgi:serine protease Do
MVPDVLFRTPAFIDTVLPGSQVAKAGLKPDDLVVFVNDELIKSCKTLKSELGKLEAGDTVRLVVRRENQLVAVELQVPPEKK